MRMLVMLVMRVWMRVLYCFMFVLVFVRFAKIARPQAPLDIRGFPPDYFPSHAAMKSRWLYRTG